MTIQKPPRNTPLRAARLRRGLTQLDLAIRVDCSLNTIALIERGGRPSAEMAKRLAAKLGTTPDALFAPQEGEPT